jgi:hypothetical protein
MMAEAGMDGGLRMLMVVVMAMVVVMVVGRRNDGQGTSENSAN